MAIVMVMMVGIVVPCLPPPPWGFPEVIATMMVMMVVPSGPPCPLRAPQELKAPWLPKDLK